MVILTLNCGSSSAKYQVYDWDNKDVLCVGVVERIGLEYSTIEQKSTGKEEYEARFTSPTHMEAIELILKMLTDETYGCIKSLDEIGAVGHRVLHGGEYFKKSTLVTDEVIEKLTGGEAEVQPGGEAEDGEEAHVVPAEEMDSKDCGMAMDKAMAAGILKAMRPTVAAIKDDKQRRAVSDALIKCVTAQDAANDIANIMQAAQANAKAKAKPVMDMDKIQASYDALNPHKRKETK